MVKKARKLQCFASLQTSNEKIWSIKIVGVVEGKKNYRLVITRSPFPNMYPVFHVSELEPFHKIPKTLVPAPAGSQRIIHILGSKKHQGQYQYLVAYRNDKQEWVNADVFDDNPHYAELLEDYQDFSYSQFITNVVNH